MNSKTTEAINATSLYRIFTLNCHCLCSAHDVSLLNLIIVSYEKSSFPSFFLI